MNSVTAVVEEVFNVRGVDQSMQWGSGGQSHSHFSFHNVSKIHQN